MLPAGGRSGVFQMGSTGMTGVCVGLKPHNIEDITAIIALYRPGPMDSISRFIACKQDPKLIRYRHPSLEPILSITYGCIVYQEQVIQIFQQLGGYSLGQADMVRRAMSKKKAKDIEKEQEAFLHGDPARNIAGCVANGIPEETAEAIYQEIYDFANYAFNKAHAAAYAVVAYQTAYFKCHYTREYMTALLTFTPEKVPVYINECKDCGIALLPPDVNCSMDRFTLEEKGIRFGLVAIKSIGRGFVQAIMRERKENGPFLSLQDFCRRMTGSEINKRAVENLICCGAFDFTGAKRSQLVQIYERILDAAAAQQRKNLEGQMDFFNLSSSRPSEDFVLPDIPEYSAQERMNMEKETMGLYLSGHPIDAYQERIRSLRIPQIGAILEDFAQESGPSYFSDGQYVSLAGVVVSSKVKPTKNNSLMAYVTLEDKTASIELLCFNRLLEQCGSYLQENSVIMAKGKLSVREEKAPQLLCDFAYPLESVLESAPPPAARGNRLVQGKKLYLKFPNIEHPSLRHMRLVFTMFPGETPVCMLMADTRKLYGSHILLHEALLEEARETLGEENVVVK